MKVTEVTYGTQKILMKAAQAAAVMGVTMAPGRGSKISHTRKLYITVK